MEVKLVKSKSMYELQEAINDFISNKEKVSVSISTYNVGYAVYYTACILYK